MVSRARSGSVSVQECVASWQFTTCRMAAATVRPLRFVRCISPAWPSWLPFSIPSSGASSAAATRGSPLIGGSSSLVTSSDCTTTRTGPSSDSTW